MKDTSSSENCLPETSANEKHCSRETFFLLPGVSDLGWQKQLQKPHPRPAGHSVLPQRSCEDGSAGLQRAQELTPPESMPHCLGTTGPDNLSQHLRLCWKSPCDQPVNLHKLWHLRLIPPQSELADTSTMTEPCSSNHLVTRARCWPQVAQWLYMGSRCSNIVPSSASLPHTASITTK